MSTKELHYRNFASGSFSRRLGEILDARGWNQKEAAERLGVSQANVSRWLHGGHEPSLLMSVQIAARLGVPLDELTGPATKPSVVREIGPQEREPARYDPAMQDLKKRYAKANVPERETIRLALTVLFPKQWERVLEWLGK